MTCHKLRYPSEDAKKELRLELRVYRCSRCGWWHIGDPGRGGRPRKHPNGAARQADYRRRKKNTERKRLVQRIVDKTLKTNNDTERRLLHQMLEDLPLKELRRRERELWGSPGAEGKYSHRIALFKRLVRELRRAES